MVIRTPKDGYKGIECKQYVSGAAGLDIPSGSLNSLECLARRSDTKPHGIYLQLRATYLLRQDVNVCSVAG